MVLYSVSHRPDGDGVPEGRVSGIRCGLLASPPHPPYRATSPRGERRQTKSTCDTPALPHRGKALPLAPAGRGYPKGG